MKSVPGPLNSAMKMETKASKLNSKKTMNQNYPESKTQASFVNFEGIVEII